MTTFPDWQSTAGLLNWAIREAGSSRKVHVNYVGLVGIKMPVASRTGRDWVSGYRESLVIAGGIDGSGGVGVDITALHSGAKNGVDETGRRGARGGRITAKGGETRAETSTVSRTVDNVGGGNRSHVGHRSGLIGSHLGANEIRDGDAGDHHDDCNYDQQFD